METNAGGGISGALILTGLPGVLAAIGSEFDEMNAEEAATAVSARLAEGTLDL
jgi:hypothetical protein